ncbi:MAG: SusC/RagA family TonB-linked outer membrane protein [Balneola sp.]
MRKLILIRNSVFAFIMTLVITVSAFAQNRVVSGVIIDADTQEPIPSVTVLLQGTAKGVASDVDGRYELTLTQEELNNGILIFSSIGYIARNIPINGNTTINVELSLDIALLDDVVVVGYGSQIKEKVTGNISTIKASEFETVPVNSFEQAIQGRASGVFIQTNNGKLGQGIQVRVRGSSSLNGSNQPLYIVDGIPVTTDDFSRNAAQTNPLADLNPADIASIDILKDASAAAIYGSRGSNGVVLITTKSGGAGQTQIDVNYAIATSEPTNKREFLNGPEYLELITEAYINSPFNTTGTIDGLIGGRTLEARFDVAIPGWDEGNDTNFQDLAFQENTSQKFDISASGGDAKTRFFISGQVDDQEGIVIDNAFQRLSGRLNLDHSASEKLDIGLNLSLARTVNDRLSTDNAFSTPLQLVALPPVQRAFNDDGTPSNATVYDNGLLYRDGATFETTVFRSLARAYAAYNVIPELTLRAEFGVDVLNQNEERWFGSTVSQFTGFANGTADNRFVRSVNWTSQAFAQYQPAIGEDHELDLTVGMSAQEQTTDITSVTGTDFPNDLFRQVASTANITFGTATTTVWSLVGYFARANYAFDGKYLLSVSGRVDGSSRFGADNQYGFFPAASAGWIISNESFMEDIDQISFLKAKASFGLTGNTPTLDFGSRFLFGAGSYSGASALTPNQVPNPDLKWETTQQFNIGLEFGLFSDRITAEVDYYQKKTEDLLLNVNIPGTTGFLTQLQNVGELENKGFEFLVTTVNTTGDLNWTTTLNFGKNDNEITNLDGQVVTGTFVSQAREGEPIGVFFAREYAGVNPDNGDALYWVNSADGIDHSTGTTNNANNANPVAIGNPNPDFQGGITNNLSYKGFDLSVFFQFVYGNDIYNGAGRFMSTSGDFYDNQTRDQLNRWQNPGDVTDVPQARLFGSNGTAHSSRYLEDGSYLRLKTLTLGYNLPANVLSNIGLRTARVYFTGLNLLTFTDYSGWDPEVNTDFSASNVTLGSDFYAAPQAKTYTVGINIGF